MKHGASTRTIAGCVPSSREPINLTRSTFQRRVLAGNWPGQTLTLVQQKIGQAAEEDRRRGTVVARAFGCGAGVWDDGTARRS